MRSSIPPIPVARMVAALDAEPQLAAVGCRIVTHADGDDDLSSWGYPSSLLPRAGECFDTVTFVGAGHALRRAAWEQAGGYDDSLFFCWEEFDFCLRAIALGWWIRYHGDIVIRHKVSGERRVSWGGDRWFYFVRNRLHIRTQTWAGLVRDRASGRGLYAEGMPQPPAAANPARDRRRPSHGATRCGTDVVTGCGILLRPQRSSASRALS